MGPYRPNLGPGSTWVVGCIAYIVSIVAGVAACQPRAPAPRETLPTAPGPGPGGVLAPDAWPADESLPSNIAYGSDPEPAPDDAGEEARVVERAALALLEEHGQEVLADGRLSKVARWGARQLATGGLPSTSAIDVVARRVGHVGTTPFLVLLRARNFASLSERTIAGELRRQLDALPGNLVLSRYGVGAVARAGEIVIALAVASVELTLEALPKHPIRGSTVHLAGRLAARFDAVRLSITRPSGAVRSVGAQGRVFASDVRVDQPGVHRIELLGEGKSGPVIVANFPLYVDADEPEIPPAAEAPRSPGRPLLSRRETAAESEQRMFDLLRDARGQAHVGPLVPDEELAVLARSHSEDMAAHHFFGHVSPTTGGPEDRVRAAKLALSRFGENVARAPSAQDAHAALMDSPAHRANMLDPSFTHVGIGAAVRVQPDGEPLLHVTILFARRVR